MEPGLCCNDTDILLCAATDASYKKCIQRGVHVLIRDRVVLSFCVHHAALFRERGWRPLTREEHLEWRRINETRRTNR